MRALPTGISQLRHWIRGDLAKPRTSSPAVRSPGATRTQPLLTSSSDLLDLAGAECPGSTARGAAHYQDARTRRRRGKSPSAEGFAHVGMAEILRERNELDSALVHATEGIVLLQRTRLPLAAGRGPDHPGPHPASPGRPAGALEAIGEAEQIGPSPQVIHVQPGAGSPGAAAARPGRGRRNSPLDRRAWAGLRRRAQLRPGVANT